MVRINLLPHRAEKRRIRQIQFFSLVGVSLFLGVVVIGLGDWLIRGQIEHQNLRNDYLKVETAKLDKEIAEIQKLRKEIEGLQKRKAVVDNLQEARFDVVHLLDQMLRILPEGVYLKSLKQAANNKINIVGMTQSNARVSTLMESIEDSPWLGNPELIEIHAVGAENTPSRLSEFTLTFDLTKATKANKSGKKKGGV